jgi:UDP-galactopyranose mutase
LPRARGSARAPAWAPARRSGPLSSRADLLIVGAGPVGCVVAERAAQAGWTSVVVERRPHVAGHCYDLLHGTGVLVHAYGPHYFRTDRLDTVEYLSRFTEWIPARYVVKSRVGGRLYPFPINLDTLEQFFGRSFTPEQAREFLEAEREPFAKPTDSEQLVLSRVGRRLYEAFYRGYTLKQWAREPRDLDPSVCGRIPVRLNRDDRYVDSAFQAMPARGYTALFGRMLDDPRITVRTGVDYFDVRHEFVPRIGTVYTGEIDRYFEYRFGPLEWRSLRFELRALEREWVQPCVQINYPDEHDFTRSVEFKHVTGQVHPSTVVAYEYPEAIGEPYYPVHTRPNLERYERYRRLAEEATRRESVYFAGRLARYAYINIDEAVDMALQVFATIRAPTVDGR